MENIIENPLKPYLKKKLMLLLVLFIDVCRQVHFLQRIADKALIGHVIKTIPVETYDHCEIACFRDLVCLSYNIGPKQAGGHQCELSKSDHIRDPADLVPMAGYIYRPTEVHNVMDNFWVPKHLTLRMMRN